MSNLSLRWKLYGGMGAILALLTFIGLFGISQLRAEEQVAEEIYEKHTVGLTFLLQAKAQLIASGRDQFTTILAEDPAEVERNANNARQFLASATESLTKYQGTLVSETNRQKTGAVIGEMQALVPAREQVFTLAKAGKDAEALAQAKQIRERVDRIGASMDELEAGKLALAKQAHDDGAAAGARAEKLMLGALALAILIGAGVAVTLSNGIVHGVRDVQQVLTSLTNNCTTNLAAGLKEIAAGNLGFGVQPTTRPIARHGNDEIGQTAALTNRLLTNVQQSVMSYEQARAGLATVVRQIQQTADGLTEASGQLASAAQESGAASNQVATAIQQVAAGVTEQAGSVDAAASSVQEMEAQARQVGQMVELIRDVAERTDLLALNAAIEAARAGAAGKGFAVVAEEVRKLAEKTSGALSEIDSTVRGIASAAQRAAEATTSLAAVSEQTAAASEEISASTEEMTAQVQSTSAQAQELSATAEELRQAVARFRLGDEQYGHAPVALDEERWLRRAA